MVGLRWVDLQAAATHASVFVSATRSVRANAVTEFVQDRDDQFVHHGDQGSVPPAAGGDAPVVDRGGGTGRSGATPAHHYAYPEYIAHLTQVFAV
jgi:hypothetical protein